MKTIWTFALGMAAGCLMFLHSSRPSVQAAPIPPVPALAAAQGRVEGRSEKIEVEASTDGVIRELLVKEGAQVSAGQIVARLACDDLSSQVQAADAALESARQARLRILRGSRDEERRAADQDVRAAQAVADQARRQSTRMRQLHQQDVMPLVTAEDAQRDAETADASLRASLERQKLAYAGPLPEEVSKADADAITAERRLDQAKALLDKCAVRTPIAGTVTRVHLRAGEAQSTVMPRPIVTVVDLSERKVRAEVDERDLERVRLHQKVRMSADGFARTFGGEITWLSVQMGRKTARSTDPADKFDRDVLETVITPDRDAPPLPIGLRVTVEFLKD